MKVAAGPPKGLCHGHRPLDARHALDLLLTQRAAVANDADDGVLIPL